MPAASNPWWLPLSVSDATRPMQESNGMFESREEILVLSLVRAVICLGEQRRQSLHHRQ